MQDDEGDIDIGALEEMLQRAPARLVAITHIPTSSGRVYNAAAVGEVAQAAGVPYLLDACQSVGQVRSSTTLFLLHHCVWSCSST